MNNEHHININSELKASLILASKLTSKPIKDIVRIGLASYLECIFDDLDTKTKQDSDIINSEIQKLRKLCMEE